MPFSDGSTAVRVMGDAVSVQLHRCDCVVCGRPTDAYSPTEGQKAWCVPCANHRKATNPNFYDKLELLREKYSFLNEADRNELDYTLGVFIRNFKGLD